MHRKQGDTRKNEKRNRGVLRKKKDVLKSMNDNYFRTRLLRNRDRVLKNVLGTEKIKYFKIRERAVRRE